MDTEMLPMFPLEEFTQDLAPVPEYQVPEYEGEASGSEVGERGADGRPAGNRDAGDQPVLHGATAEPGRGSASNGRVRQTADAGWVYERAGLEGHYPLSPLALLFPDLSQEAMGSLALDIAANGLLEEITVAGDPPHIVDGKHRLRACEMAGVQPSYRLLREDIDPRDYVWGRNGERRDLTKSQRALAAAELFSFPGPGRPRAGNENSAVLQDIGKTTGKSTGKSTMDRIASQSAFSTRLLSGAVKIADIDGPAVPELRDAVRQGFATVTDAAQDVVLKSLPEVQRQAVALVKNGDARTVAAAVERVARSRPGPDGEEIMESHPTARFGERAIFHLSSLEGMARRTEPASVHLVVASPPEDSGSTVFSDLTALASRALTPGGLLVVAVLCRQRLPQIQSRLERGGLEWIIDLSLVFPYPVFFSGEPHRIGLRRVALLVFGKPGARLDIESDVIEMPHSSTHPGGDALVLEDGMATVVKTLAIGGEVVCEPMMGESQGAALAAVSAGCIFIGGTESQACIDRALRQLASAAPDPLG